ncbi:TPA: acyltransferase family protein [Pseudomonas putida]
MFKSVMSVSGSARYKGMEGLRAYAVILTFFVHYFTYVFGAFHKINPNSHNVSSAFDISGSIYDSFMIYLFRGQYGVDLFFILSGFLIARVMGRGIGGYSSFVINRIHRIYPVFIASLVVAIVAKVYMVPHMTLDAMKVVKSLFLVYIDYNYPSWSLRYELLFYFSVPMIYAVLKKTTGSTSAYRASLLLLFSLLILVSDFPRASMFAVGMLVASYSDDELKILARNLPDWIVAALALLVTTTYAFRPDYLMLMPFFALAFSVLMVNAVYGEGFINKIFTVWPLRFIGNISYSFYMIHGPAITIGYWVTTRIIKPSTQLGIGLSVFSVSIVLTIVLSLIFFYALELPYFNRKKSRKTQAPAALTN